MILIAMGSNLPSRFGGPRETLEAALARLAEKGLSVAARSPWYETAPVPVSDQPWYVNGVARIETGLDAVALLAVLHAVEAEFGRVRTIANAARCIDLDLLAYGETIRNDAPILPHPRMQERAFVLLPLADVAPGWVHPVSRRSVEDMIASLPPGQGIRRAAP